MTLKVKSGVASFQNYFQTYINTHKYEVVGSYTSMLASNETPKHKHFRIEFCVCIYKYFEVAK